MSMLLFDGSNQRWRRWACLNHLQRGLVRLQYPTSEDAAVERVEWRFVDGTAEWREPMLCPRWRCLFCGYMHPYSHCRWHECWCCGKKNAVHPATEAREQMGTLTQRERRDLAALRSALVAVRAGAQSAGESRVAVAPSG